MDGKVIDIPDPKRASHYYFLIRNSFNKNPYGVFSKTPKSEWRHKLLEELKYSRTYFEDTTEVTTICTNLTGTCIMD